MDVINPDAVPERAAQQSALRVWKEPQEIWKRNWDLVAQHFNEGTLALLWEAHNKPERTFHNAHRVAGMLEGLSAFCRPEGINLDIKARKNVIAAIFFQDAVYNVFNADGTINTNNETDSADFFLRCLRDGVPQEDMRKSVPAMIKRTAGHVTAGASEAEKFFLDLGIRTFGGDLRAYALHATHYRGEYKDLPEHMFRESRIAVLRGFLLRDPLFQTPLLRDAYEEQAQRNLTWEISRLSSPRMGVTNPYQL